MQELIILALTIPIAAGISSLFQAEPGRLRLLNLAGSIGTSLTLALLVYQIALNGTFHQGMFYLDHLSGVMLMVVAALSFSAFLFSASYMENEVTHGKITVRELPRYYALLNLFVFTMISVLVVENLGLMWVAVEATTLASALLVAFYFSKAAIEAAWKYVMVCTVGICLALLGTILLYYAQVSAAGAGPGALSWLILRGISADLDPAMVKLAFVFIAVGYGTKAGFAPMHTWLPDAHSEAPSPVSGLLSGALLSCAVYALIRNIIIVQGTLGPQFPQLLLLGFGLVSIAIAIPFILVQHDIKRLLAYSSVEHMGIIAFAFGLGTPSAAYGALLHIINHAVAKSALFYLAGTITQEFRTKHIMRIRGLIGAMPAVGTMFIIAMLAITGTPPFNIFGSKFAIVWSAFTSGNSILGWVILTLLAGIFAGMMYYCVCISFGQALREPSSVRIGSGAMAAMVLSMSIIIVMGFYMPPWLNSILIQAAAIVSGG